MKKKNTYVKGLIGALVGALAGLIAWVLVAYFVGGNLHLSFGFVLALLAYLGYSGMGGKLGKGIYAIYIPVVLIIGFAAFTLAKSIVTVNSLGADTISTYAAGEFGGNMVAAYLSLLGFGILSVFENIASIWTEIAISIIFEISGGAYFLMKMQDTLKTETNEKEPRHEAGEDEQEEKPEEDASETDPKE